MPSIMSLYHFNKVFQFNQGEVFDLGKEDQEYMRNSPFKTPIINQGACLAIVIEYIGNFENFSTNNVKDFFINLNKKLREKGIIEKYYKIMGMQELITKKYRNSNIYSEKLTEYYSNRSSGFRHSQISNMHDLNMSQKINLEMLKEINKKRKSMEQHTGHDINKLQQLDEAFDLLYPKVSSKIDQTKSEFKRMDESFIRGVNLQKEIDTCGTIHIYNFVQNNILGWEYNQSFKTENWAELKNYLISLKSNLQNTSKIDASTYCISLSLTLDEGGHQICVVYTKVSGYQFIIFDPNFGTYSFSNETIFFQALLHLVNNFYKTVKFTTNEFKFNLNK
jgi:hypothetical protein